MRYHLEFDPVGVPVTQFDHRFYAANLGLRINVGMSADGDRSVGEAGFERTGRARNHVIACHSGRKSLVAGQRAIERPGWISDDPPGPRLVNMLVQIDQSRNDQLALKIDVFDVRDGALRSTDCRNASVRIHENVE